MAGNSTGSLDVGSETNAAKGVLQVATGRGGEVSQPTWSGQVCFGEPAGSQRRQEPPVLVSRNCHREDALPLAGSREGSPASFSESIHQWRNKGSLSSTWAVKAYRRGVLSCRRRGAMSGQARTAALFLVNVRLATGKG